MVPANTWWHKNIREHWEVLHFLWVWKRGPALCLRIASADTPVLRPLLTLNWAVGEEETLFAQRVHFCPLEVKHQCLNPPVSTLFKYMQIFSNTGVPKPICKLKNTFPGVSSTNVPGVDFYSNFLLYKDHIKLVVLNRGAWGSLEDLSKLPTGSSRWLKMRQDNH